MSTFNYSVQINPEADICYSPMNATVSQYHERLYNTRFYQEMTCTTVDCDYESCGGQPICHVLEWEGPEATEDDARLELPREERIYSQLRAMAAQEHTRWKLNEIYLSGDGTVHLTVKNIDRHALRDPNSHLWQSDAIRRSSWQNFHILFEMRSSGFVRGRYLIDRRREATPSGTVTKIEVIEEMGEYLRQMAFEFNDNGSGTCEVTECRR